MASDCCPADLALDAVGERDKCNQILSVKGTQDWDFLASILKFVLFLYKLCQNITILQKNFFDQAITGGDMIFPLSSETKRNRV